MSVTGNDDPEKEKPAPVTVAEFIVTAAVPVEVKVSDWVDVEFTVTSPKVTLAALIVNCGLRAAVPFPLRLTTAVLLVAELLLMVSCPVAAPVAVGANWTASVTVWPGFSVSGKVAPESVKPAPVSAAVLIVTGAVPVEVKVTDCVDVEFTVTSPKVKLAALMVNCGLVAAVPVPFRLTTAVLLVAESLLMVNCPVAAPVADGVNLTDSVTA